MDHTCLKPLRLLHMDKVYTENTHTQMVWCFGKQKSEKLYFTFVQNLNIVDNRFKHCSATRSEYSGSFSEYCFSAFILKTWKIAKFHPNKKWNCCFVSGFDWLKYVSHCQETNLNTFKADSFSFNLRPSKSEQISVTNSHFFYNYHFVDILWQIGSTNVNFS